MRLRQGDDSRRLPSPRFWLLVGVIGIAGGAIWMKRPRDRTFETDQVPPMPVAAEPLPRLAARSPDDGGLNDGAARPAADAGLTGPATAHLLDEMATVLIAAGRWTEARQHELKRLEARLLALGEAAVPSLLERLDRQGDSQGVREFYFHVLRQLPGARVQERLIREARGGREESLRTMAIESLGHKRDADSLRALTDIARFDPELPVQPFFSIPRDPDVVDTELPHDTDYTPRLEALDALRARKDPGAAAVLADLAVTGPDPSIRLHAAQNMSEYVHLPGPRAALLTAARSDGSAYVRLAAIGSLRNADHSDVRAALASIAKHDRDAGVRELARQALAGPPPR